MLFADASYADLLFWVWLWKIMLIGVLAGFAGMAVWVSIGGAVDIKRMFAHILANHEAEKRRQSQQRQGETNGEATAR